MYLVYDNIVYGKTANWNVTAWHFVKIVLTKLKSETTGESPGLEVELCPVSATKERVEHLRRIDICKHKCFHYYFI